MDTQSNRSLGELFTELSRDTARLVRKELELAQVELQAIAGTMARRAVFIGIGAVLCLAGVLSLVATATLAAIAMGLSAVAASAVVTLLVFAIGGLLVWRGLAALRADTFVPMETIQTLKDAGEIFRAPAAREAHLGHAVATAPARRM
jgi:uncharacterized membrane protein YqjE